MFFLFVTAMIYMLLVSTMNVNGVDRPRQRSNLRKVKGPKLVWRQESLNMLRDVFLSIGKIMKIDASFPDTWRSVYPIFR